MGHRGATDDRAGPWRRATVTPRAFRWSWVVPVAAATMLLSAAAAGGGTLPADAPIARWIQGAPAAAATPLARFAYWVGSAPALALVAVGVAVWLLWRGNWGAALFVVATMLARGLNPVLKALLDSPRPTPGAVRVTEQAAGLGFPSGHAMGAMLLYGGLLLLTFNRGWPRSGRPVVRVVAMLVIAVVGFGRVSSGAHWPSDVLGGWLWGATLLLLLWGGAERIGRARSRRSA